MRFLWNESFIETSFKKMRIAQIIIARQILKLSFSINEDEIEKSQNQIRVICTIFAKKGTRDS